MSNDSVDDGDKVRVVRLKGPIWGHVLDYIIKERVHLTFLEYEINGIYYRGNGRHGFVKYSRPAAVTDTVFNPSYARSVHAPSYIVHRLS